MSASPRPTAEHFAAHLRARAAGYFPELDGAALRVRLVRADARPACDLYRFAVESGEERRNLLVKVPFNLDAARGEAAEPAAPQRPRHARDPDPATRFALEHTALSAIHQHFARLGDPRFGTVRVFDLLPEHRALVMEAVLERSFRDLFLGATRWRSLLAAGVELEPVFHNCGAWLRAYHALPKEEGVEARHTRRDDLVEFVERMADFIGRHLDRVPALARMAAEVGRLARRALPEALPLGLAHGDFAMRNVLVGPGHRVTVLDTLARFRTCVYEDLGYFLTALHCNGARVLGSRSAFHPGQLEGYERAFLDGYFGPDRIPHAAVRLFEVAAMLDAWSFAIARRARARSAPDRLLRTVRLGLLSRFLERRIGERLSAVARAAPAQRTQSPWSGR